MRLSQKLRGFTLKSALLSQSDIKVRGFTLIELLVAISIIALLTAVATVSYTEVRKQIRNRQRQTDLHNLATALERYYADHGTYPQTNAGGQFEGAVNCQFDKICCLLGGTIAQNVTAHPGSTWTCTAPFNKYIEPGGVLGTPGSGFPFTYVGLPNDPLVGSTIDERTAPGNTYAYASTGQTYILATLRYEGTPPASNIFSTSFDPFYSDKADDWNPGLGYDWWEDQYALKSPAR